MPKAIILGGSGHVAQLLTAQLIGQEYEVHSVIRNPGQGIRLQAMGAVPRVQSLETASTAELAATFRAIAPSVIIWSAGAGGGDPIRTRTVDYDGAVKAMDAAALAGVSRYLVVSAVDLRDRDGKPAPDWYDEADLASSDKVWRVMKPYMQAKFAADRELVTGNARRGLRYTIVRPGEMTHDKGVGTVNAGRVHIKGSVSREDVAAVLVACIEDEGTVGRVFDVVKGDTPIKEAVRQVALDKADTFEGLY